MADIPLPLDGETVVRAHDTPRPSGGERFAPGTVIADRYRIVAPLGRGGMGEVYRADDLRLGQPVALKFLPHNAVADRAKLDRLYAEVRIGRQVSHPNVCRLYDVIEWNDTHFIAMELVDGEDLASLLRRIGKLPHDKALDIARDLAGGLAAAHDLGVVHRDLKPANVMIDGRGRARITDFGLAVIADDVNARGWAGTPAYMAPEQLRGGAVTPKTDIYALGLILYEIFTGKRVFEGTTLQEILAKHASTPSPAISSTLRDIDPAVERVLVRCLDEDPAARPSSAHAVIASLPGGDPLAAAVAAGDTPSPEMVAAAGKVGNLRPAVAWGALGLVVLGIILGVWLDGQSNAVLMFPAPKSTDVLEAQARDIAASFGYADPPADVGRVWVANEAFLGYMIRRHRAATALRLMPHVRPGLFILTTRLSSRRLMAVGEDARIALEDPPLRPGQQRIMVDSLGRLIDFLAIPPGVQAPLASPPKFDWITAFRAAGLEPARFHAVTPTWNAEVDSDERLAWDGTIAGQEDMPTHVEARSRLGKPVWFSVLGPWDQPPPLHDEPAGLRIIPWTIQFMMDFGLLPLAFVLAIRNVRRGRADTKSATRLSIVCGSLVFIAYLLRADHVPIGRGETEILMRFAGLALFNAARLWVYYIALEPWARRRWPQTLISWTRLLSGRFRDPMVGRDILVGIIGGCTMFAVLSGSAVAAPWLGLNPAPPLTNYTSPMASPRHVIFFLLTHAAFYPNAALTLLILVALVHAIIRNRIAALAVTYALTLLVFLPPPSGTDPREFVPAVLVAAAILLTLLLRGGVLPVALAGFTIGTIHLLPLTFDTSAWYFGRSLLVLIVFAALAVYGFVVSLGGKPLFGTPLLDE